MVSRGTRPILLLSWRNSVPPNPTEGIQAPHPNWVCAFATEQVVKVIKQRSNSIAASPDGLTILFLKHLDPRGYAFLTHIFYLSRQTANILLI